MRKNGTMGGSRRGGGGGGGDGGGGGRGGGSLQQEVRGEWEMGVRGGSDRRRLGEGTGPKRRGPVKSSMEKRFGKEFVDQQECVERSP